MLAAHTHTHTPIMLHNIRAWRRRRRDVSHRCEIVKYETIILDVSQRIAPPPTPEKVNALRAFGLDWPASRDDLAIGEHEMALVRVPKVG